MRKGRPRRRKRSGAGKAGWKRTMQRIEGLLGLLLFCCCTALTVSFFCSPQEKSEDSGSISEEDGYDDETAAAGAEPYEPPEMAADLKVQDFRSPSTVLPVRYNSREEGKAAMIKNQGQLGTCWAVAASSALEIALLPEEQLVFSADHISARNAFGLSQSDGGDYAMVLAYLTGWQGPVAEEDDPYGDGWSPENLVPVRHVQELRIFEGKDIDGIKRAVYRYGAVQTSVYMDMENAFSESAYYNSAAAAYCYNQEAEANHDILIVGWDDTFSPDLFYAKTASPGAFICQNSWGEEFGEDGIFYISYEDCAIGKHGVAVASVEDPSNYDTLYQTDLCGWTGQLGYGNDTCWFANVYECKEDCRIRAVGFYTLSEDCSYEVFCQPAGEKMPSLTLEIPNVRGRIDERGFYTVRLAEPVEVKQGERFVTAVKMCTDNTEYPAAVEYYNDEYRDYVDLSDGEGYISSNGTIWNSTEQEYQCNVCLKAYADIVTEN